MPAVCASGDKIHGIHDPGVFARYGAEDRILQHLARFVHPAYASTAALAEAAGMAAEDAHRLLFPYVEDGVLVYLKSHDAWAVVMPRYTATAQRGCRHGVG